MTAPIRLLKSAALYPHYLEQFYGDRPGLEAEDYRTQWATLMADRFTWADAWKRTLEGAPGFAVEEVIPNAEPLQRAWAREHGVAVPGADWELAILRAQLEAFQPDVYFQHGFNWFTPAIRSEWRRAMPGIRLFVGYDGIGRNDPAYFQGCDLILSCIPETAEAYRRHGMDGVLMKLGFDRSILPLLGPRHQQYDVSFIGGITLGRAAHGRRIRLLAEVARQLHVDFHLALPGWLAVPRAKAIDLLMGRRTHFVRSGLRLARDYATLRRCNRGPLYGLRMYEALASSRITLNVHIDSAGGDAVNMRLFEATGVGTCLVTDRRPGLEQIFEPGREVATFESAEECVAIVRGLLADEPRRAAMASAGQARTFRDHEFQTEVVAMAEVIRDRLDRQGRH